MVSLQLDLSNLDKRITKLESVVFAKPEPVENDQGDTVYDNLKNWLIRPAESRIQSYSKTNAASSPVRQLLFERQNKALAKYGSGLKISTKLPTLQKAAEKLADAAFFLYHAYHVGDGKADEKYLLVQNLHTLLNNLLHEFKNKIGRAHV